MTIYSLALFFLVILSFCSHSHGDTATATHLMGVALTAHKLAEQHKAYPRLIVSPSKPSSKTDAIQERFGAEIVFTEDMEKPQVINLKNIGIQILKFRKSASLSSILKVVQYVQRFTKGAILEADSIRSVTTGQIKELDESSRLNGRTSENSVFPNDDYWNKMWGLRDIDAPPAWGISTGENAVQRPKVVVIDTGVDFTHPDLADSIWTNYAELNGQEGVDDDGNGYIDDIHGWNAIEQNGSAMDDNGHGTHVSGTIGAKGNNTIGIPGVNWHPEIIGCKFLDYEASGWTSDALVCIDYSIAVGASISSNSWSGSTYSHGLKSAIDTAANYGQLFVAAAGNKGQDNGLYPRYPASYDSENIIAVAALNQTNELPYWSNYGSTTVHLAAPGRYILSLQPSGSYAIYSGTSMACSHVSGVASLLQAVDPKATYKELKHYIKNSVQTFPDAAKVVIWGGKLNAYSALLYQSRYTTTTTQTLTSTTTLTTTITTATKTSTTTAQTLTTTAMQNTTTEGTKLDGDMVILGSSSLTCRENCNQSGLECNDEATTKMNTDIDFCFYMLKTSAVPGRFVKRSLGFVNYPVYPTGCYTVHQWSYYMVSINTNDYSSGKKDCDAPPSPLAASSRPCVCRQQ